MAKPYNLYTVFDQLIASRLSDFDLSPLLIYMVDLVDQKALPSLAAQFEVDGFKGWTLATTEKQQRELIKTAISIKRHLGTPYAIKQALAAIGFDQVNILEGVQQGSSFTYDGTHLYNGSILYGGANWTAFEVDLLVSDPAAITDETVIQIKQLIGYYKNARSTLTALVFKEADLQYYDGSYKHDGAITYR
jgi:phage tail P2-like protein